MFHREPLLLPFASQVPVLRQVLDGDGPVQPPAPTEFVDAAVEHRLIAACVRAVDEGRLTLPEREARSLRDAQTVITLVTALARRELPATAAAIATETGMSAIVLKGPAIADRFYPDPGLRAFSDLDLLVDRGSLEPAKRALARIGYEEEIEFRPGFGATHGHTIDMAKPLGGRTVHVEVHWRVSDDALGLGLSHAALSAEARPVPGVPGAAYAAPPDQLLVCSMHLLNHREKRLAWIEDINRIAGELDASAWLHAFRRAEELGLLWALHRALDYAERHLGLARERPLPAGEPPAFGPIRALEELDFQASVNIGRLAALPWRKRPGLIRDILIPTPESLEKLVGGDGAGRARQVGRHLALIARGVTLRR